MKPLSPEEDKKLMNEITIELKQEEALKKGTFSILSIIGHGTFGVVYRAKEEKTGEIFAIKRVFQDKKYKNRELEILKELNHPNVINLKHYFYTKTEKEGKEPEIFLNCVMDYFPQTLSRILSVNFQSRKQLDPFIAKLYAYQMMLSLKYLHSKGIAHRDIKPQNILVEPKTNKIKVCDFGSAKKLIQGQKSISYICSRFYRAPELIFGATDYTNQIDVWSMGCVISELVLGRPMFPGATTSDQLVEIIRILGTPTKNDICSMNPHFKDHKFPDVKPIPFEKLFKNRIIPEHFLDLLSKLLVYNPQIRLTPEKALEHAYFDEIKKIDKNHGGKYKEYDIPLDLEI
jgi:glycogen synthase kinase 3 beta